MSPAPEPGHRVIDTEVATPERHARLAGWLASTNRLLITAVLVAVLVAIPTWRDADLFTNLRADWWRVSSPAATTLGGLLAGSPTSVEVVASQGVIGRFADRGAVYPDVASPQAFPVRSRSVLFVLTSAQGHETVPVARIDADVAYVQKALRAKLLVRRDGVTSFLWHPPPGTTSVTLP